MRKNPHSKILKRKSKEEYLSTVSKYCSKFNGRTWAIWDGLELVVSLGFTHAIVELDAQVVVSLIGLVNAHDYLMPHYG